VPNVSVLIVDFDAGLLLDRCLAALAAQSDKDFEVLLLDNGSKHHDPIVPEALAGRLTRLASATNLGFAAGNNLAAGRAAGAWLALLNPDAFPEPDWLAEFAVAAARYPDAAMFGSTQLLASDPATLDGAGDCLHPLCYAWRGDRLMPADSVVEDGEVFGPCAAAAFYRTDAFAAAGGFESRFFCYYEDVDLAFRLRLAGHHCVQLARARVRHVGSAVTGSGSDFVRYHVARNRIWLFLRNMPGPLLWPLLPLIVASQAARLALAPAVGDLPVRWRALRDATMALAWAWRSRRAIQAARRASWFDIARALTWSVGRLYTQRGDLRPIRAGRGSSDDRG
jgi:N-acetylglucosaminyl-diphospho-decaprenol L-rhamnosyltransferase